MYRSLNVISVVRDKTLHPLKYMMGSRSIQFDFSGDIGCKALMVKAKLNLVLAIRDRAYYSSRWNIPNGCSLFRLDTLRKWIWYMILAIFFVDGFLGIFIFTYGLRFLRGYLLFWFEKKLYILNKSLFLFA